jgi:hypothetical protein
MILKNLLFVLFLSLLPLTIQAQAWMNGFSYRKKLTINKSKVTAKVTQFFPSTTIYDDQVDFPVYIEIIDKDLIYKDGSCGSRIQDFEGRDISFALSTAPTVPLNFQQESYDPLTGTLRCWIKVSSLSANKTTTPATEIYMYYGGGVLHNPKSSTALQTWNTDFSKVWHMNAVYQQAGIHQINSTSTLTVPNFVEGKLDKSILLNGVTSSYVGSNELNNALTISAWIKLNAYGTEQMIVTNDSTMSGGFQLKVNTAGKLVLQVFNSLSPPTVITSASAMQQVGKWYHIWATVISGNIGLYIDNKIVNSTASSSLRLGPGGRIVIGASKQGDKFFNGEIDELRIQKAIISTEWMTTCHTNQIDPQAFYTKGSEEVNTAGFSRYTGINQQWNLSSNWAGNIIPPANSNILIPAGKIVLSSSNNTFNRLIIEAGATLEVSSDVGFNCIVNIANNAVIKVNDVGKVRFGGNVNNDGQILANGLTSKVIFDGVELKQEYSGSGTAIINALENNQGNLSNTLLLTSPLQVTGTINIKQGKIKSDRTLVMKAFSQTATASLLPINPLVASIIGDVIVEQFISGGYPSPATARGWRLLSSPVYSSNTATSKSYDSRSFLEGVFITGIGGSLNGFDPSPQNGGTMYTHDQSLPGTLSQKYTAIKQVDQKIELGKGVYLFSRGSRSVFNAYNSQIQTQPFVNPQAFVLKHVGRIFSGELSIPLSNNDMQGIGDGFNLIGNPYPSSLRWGDIATEKTGPFIWQYDPLNAAYIVDDSPNAIIPSGTGFFVRVNTGEKTGSLTFTEQSKSNISIPSIPLLQSLAHSSDAAITDAINIKVVLKNNKFEQRYVLKLNDTSFDGIDDQDALKIGEGYVSISSIVGNDQLSIDSRPITASQKVISLNVTASESGSYKFVFTISPGKRNLRIDLLDSFLNTKKQLDQNDKEYSFAMDKAIIGSSGQQRFQLLIQEIVVTPSDVKNVKIYPNPFSDNLNIAMNSDNQDNLEFVLTDILGKILLRKNLRATLSLIQIDTQAFSKGVYLLQLLNGKTKKIVSTMKLLKI